MNLKALVPAILMTFALGQRMAHGQSNSAEANGVLETTCRCFAQEPLVVNAEFYQDNKLVAVKHRPDTGSIEFVENARRIEFNGKFNGSFVNYEGDAKMYNVNDAQTPKNLVDLAKEMAKNSKTACQLAKKAWVTVETTNAMKNHFKKSL